MNGRKMIGRWIACASLLSVTYTASAEKLFWRETTSSTGTRIKRSNLDGSAVEQLMELPADGENTFGLALDPGGGKMYWSEGGAGRVLAANMDGSNPEVIINGLEWPWYMALDVSGGKIYWVQDDATGTTQGVYRANLDGSGQEKLLSAKWYGIALDVVGGRMYGGGGGGSGPVRANLDGSGSELLIPNQTFWSMFGSSVWTSSVALDTDAGKVYFTVHTLATSPSSIGRCNLDGSSPEKLIQDALGEPDPLVGFPLGITLDLGRQQMYWSNGARYRISRAGLDGTLVEHVHEDIFAPTTVVLDSTAGPEIPAVSEWGAVTMTLLVIAAGTAVLVRRRGLSP